MGWETWTIRRVSQEIYQGEQPWIALGNFMNYWFCYAKDQREQLVAEAIPDAPADEHCQRWAAYCAASVEYLCNKYSVICPEWVHDPKYRLAEPWYDLPRPEFLAKLRDKLVASTPPEFSKRNIYSSDGMFANKWELVEKFQDRINQFRKLSKQERKEYYKTGKMP